MLMLLLNFLIKVATRSEKSPLVALLLMIISLMGQACSPFSGLVNEEISNNYYYSKDNKHIQYSPMGNWFELGNNRIEKAEVESFEVLANHFGKDKNHIYYQEHIIDSLIHEGSFRAEEYLCFDKDHVYRPEKYASKGEGLLTVIEGADPGTYEEIDYNWAKDAKHYFYVDSIVDVDYTSFVVLNKLFAKDQEMVYLIKSTSLKKTSIDAASVEKLDDYYILDKNCLYYFNEYEDGEVVDTLIAIPYKDVKDISILEQGYLIVKDKVYCNNEEMDQVDVASFRVLNPGQYAMDKSSVYYIGKKIKGADPESFEIMEYSYYSKDKNHVYADGKIIKGADAKTFREVKGKYGIEYRDKDHLITGNAIENGE